MPPHLKELLAPEDEDCVMHLGFGDKDDYVSEPKEGHVYI